MNNNILTSLSQYPIKNISSLGFFNNYAVEKIYKTGDSLLILGTSDQLWAYIASGSKEELSEIIKEYQFETKYFAAIENWMIPVIIKNQELEWELNTYRYILPKNQEINLSARSVFELDTSVSDYIFNNSDYKDYTSVEYIKDRINKGIGVGICKGNRLVAWGLTHDDGALGFLHVLPKYRRQGYGKQIVKGMIKKKRELDEPVFCNIEPQNNNSKNLVTELGFIFDREISWIKLR